MRMTIQMARQNKMTSHQAMALTLKDLIGHAGKSRSRRVSLPASRAIRSGSVRQWRGGRIAPGNHACPGGKPSCFTSGVTQRHAAVFRSFPAAGNVESPAICKGI
uniref:Uncharacterized protein n=1 Tax=Chelativorans sp. (strain BNC1) TaxID=266779 RepID=Q11F53_CHESB